jgi:excisionase family DNA binding protein
MSGVGGALDRGLMRPGEVAVAFGVSTRTVNRWGRIGTLRTIRTPGGHMRFFAADVLALMVAGRTARASAELPQGVRIPGLEP